jgi:hypothetical protein
MPRGLDHVVHAVHDLDAAAELYRRLGFIVGARNQHPPDWGTQNHIIQLPGFSIELLGLADTSQMMPHTPQNFSFGAFNRDFLAHRQGLSMLAIEGQAGDAEELRTAGIGEFEPLEFSREAKRPDGSQVKVAFTLIFAHDSAAPDVGFFTCRQHDPENYWNPAFQNHANGTHSILGVVLVGENPRNHENFLSAITGLAEIDETAIGIAAHTPRGAIEVVTPAAFRDRFGTEPPDTGSGARLSTLRFAVRDMAVVKELWRRAGIHSIGRGGCAIVGPDAGLGATLAFEPS